MKITDKWQTGEAVTLNSQFDRMKKGVFKESEKTSAEGMREDG